MSGSLPPGLPVIPLVRITPSKFQSFMNCRLKACWESEHVGGLLPSSPAGHIGTVIHKIIEIVGKNEIDDDTDFDLMWRQSVEEEEKKMKNSWIERHLVPLETSDPHFEIKKRQCRLITERMVREPTRKGSVSDFQKGSGKEVWLQTEDGKIGGYIDAIISTERGEIIKDFKTGSIFKPGQEGSDFSVNNQYELQLKLYAALFNSTFSKWPASLEIVGLDGAIHPVEFTPEECLNLLIKACQLLDEINLAIAANESKQKDVHKQLSSPSPENCRFCLYRPCCPSYWNAKEADPLAEWPNDAKGLITEIKNLGNGLIFIKLLLDNSEIISIRGLHPERHSALKGRPNRIAIFSMIASRVKGSFREGKYTTIYILD
jgi:hypothetical protein